MKTTKLVYLDTNVYCRPMDDQGNSRIHQEAEAFLQIADKAERGKTEIVSSDYVKLKSNKSKTHQKEKTFKASRES
jgi:predicted nucleic acid-binding protein